MTVLRVFLLAVASTIMVSVTLANDRDIEQFASETGRIAGIASACGFQKDEVNNYIRYVLEQAKSKWGPSLGRGFTSTFNNSLRSAEAASPPDLDFCQGEIKQALWYASIHNTPKTQEQPLNQLLPPQSVHPSLVSSVGTKVCRKTQGIERRVIAYGPLGPIYGNEQIRRDINIEGFTEGSSGNCKEIKTDESGCRIKVLINSIGAYSSSGGYVYLDSLPPDYTKGQHVWEYSSAWYPCQ